MMQFRVVQDRESGRYHVEQSVVWDKETGEPVTVRAASGEYEHSRNTERQAYALAVNYVANAGYPALVVGPTGAFKISVGTYPQRAEA